WLLTADRLLGGIERVMLWVAGLVVLALMVMGVAEVILRSFFRMSIHGYIDVVGLLASAIAFLALSYCQQIGGHIRMELVVGSLKGRAHWTAELIGVLVALGVVLLLLSPTFAHALRSIEL